ncbi:MAG: hypothetical protein Q9187_002375 [Circinaria calcarea]
MVGALPGRPGNLTRDQEAKLQEFWKAVLKVFGVTAEGGVENRDSIDSSVQGTDQDDLTNGKKKKKRLGLFSKKKSDARELDGANGATINPNDADDKYGQAKDFQRALSSQTPEDLRRAFWSMVKHDHPDGLLLRFLRARKWDVEKALIMLISTMHWRSQEMHVDDDIMKNGEGVAAADTSSPNAAVRKEADDFMRQLRLGKSFLHGCDKEGRPICLVRARLHHQGEQSEASLERVTVHLIETARLLLAPPADTATIIFDLTSFSLSNMDYGPVKFMIRCFEANYPESLGAVLVHKAPWVFQGVWSIIKGWLDPVVAGKVHFTKNVEELEQFIPRNHIIKELGGDEEWTFQYVEPLPKENIKMEDDATRARLLEERAATVKEFEATTQAWMQSSQSDSALMEKRNALAEKLKKGYWQLDPYLRARSLWDRTGVIKPDGSVDYYPAEKSPDVAPTSNGPTPAGHDPNDLD